MKKAIILLVCKITNELKLVLSVMAIEVLISMSGTACMSQHFQDSMVIDSDGNNYPIKLLADDKLWMTANLNLKMPASYCYEDTEENCKRFGRLYTWQSAKEGCSLLGDGWRLPRKDEWQRLSALNAPNSKDSMETRKKAYDMLLLNGGSLFNAELGGGRDLIGAYARMNAHGFYWTSTETDSLNACFANFAKGSQSLYHQNDGEKNRAFSVRCVKNMDQIK